MALAADFDGSKRRRRVRAHEGVAGPRGEDDDPTLLKVPDCSSANEGLGHRLHAEGALCSRVHADLFQRVLKCQRVDERRQHAGVVGGRALHAPVGGFGAAPNVAAAHNNGQLHARGHCVLDLLGQVTHGLCVDAIPLAAQQ